MSMETKSIEEKRAAVIAYCKEVCKGKYVDVHIPTVNIGIEENEGSFWFWTTDNQGNRAGALMGTLLTSMHTALENPFIERMYRLLDLETRHAIEVEREKAAMLLEELQEISEMYDPYSNRSDSQMAQKAKYAVEAYKN